jgi:hypothetical protein
MAVSRMDAFIVVFGDIKGVPAIEAYELSDDAFVAVTEFWRNFHTFCILYRWSRV